MTRREIIGNITDILKQEYTDTTLSKKTIWDTFKRKLRGINEQQFRDKKLWKDNSLWRTLCIDLIEVDNNDCGCLPSDLRTKIWRSKCELPKISSTSSGLLIKSILPLDNNLENEIILSTEVSAIRKKKIVKNKLYSFIKNNYLYILGEVHSVVITALFDEIALDYCGKKIEKPINSETSSTCKNPFLDVEVGISDYVLDKVMTETIAELLKLSSASPEIPPVNTSPI